MEETTSKPSEGTPKPLFRDLTAEDADPETSEIESLCLSCGENGITKLLLTKIPFFKEIVLMSFDCPHCGFQNNEIQSAGEIEKKGVRMTLEVQSEKDLNRQIIKSDYTSIRIPEVDFEIPSQSQKGEVTTVEGVIDRAITGLIQDQEVRRAEHAEIAKQVDDFIEKLKKLKTVASPFTMILEDISGNTFVSNPKAPQRDLACKVVQFVRSVEQDQTLGIYHTEASAAVASSKPPPSPFTLEDLQGEVLQFSTNCPNCGSPCKTNMKLTKIPHFKEVVIMATTCEVCGVRTNEVKSGSGIEPLGQRIVVKVNNKDEFSRDVLKSETCSLEIPELELEVGPGALGGRFTTVEGLIDAMREQLAQRGAMFGDAADETSRQSMEQFLANMDRILAGELSVTIVLDDPAGNSFVQSLTYPEPDPNLQVERYERSFEQNDVLGLNDMKTENYET
uniref:Zinc finger protein ZPR1 n=1 Tax=Cuerna arida TaxID=1464854 RepID=A0A1B6GWC0_9HEMI